MSHSGKTAKRPFAVFDIDGTLIRWQLYHAIADQLVKLGYIDRDDFIDIKNSRMDWKKRTHPESFREYEQKLVQLYSQVLGKLSYSQFNQASDLVFEEYKDQTYTYTRDLIKDLKSKGYLLFAISGSQKEVIEQIAGYYGFDDFVGTEFVHKGDTFTGEVVVPLGKKDEILRDLIDKHQASLKASYAVGDSAGDKDMLEMVENPIALNPEKKLFDYAKAKNWKIVIERKNMVYELEKDNGQYHLA